MKKYKLFIFDCDGTLIDSKLLVKEAVSAALRELNVAVDNAILNQLHKFSGIGLAELARQLFPTVDYQLFRNAFHKHYSADKLSHCFFSGAIEALRNLKLQGLRLAMATNIIREKTNAFLQAAGLQDLFDTIRCFDDGFPKPHPQMLLSILDELKISAAEAVMVGDSIYDMQLAVNAGVDAIAVDYGGSDIATLLSYNPAGYLQDIQEIDSFVVL